MQNGLIAEFRVALGAVAPVPARALRAEDLVRGRTPIEVDVHAARAALMRDIAPIDDIRSSAKYRRAVSGNVFASMLEDFLAHLG